MNDQPKKDVVFSDAVKAIQEQKGSREHYARWEVKGGWRIDIDDELTAFVAERDSFYLATANADGQPYIQHRGGPPGFLKVLDEHTLGLADYRGNRQYITVGNLSENPRVILFFMDYPSRRRIKLWGTATVVDNDSERLRRVADPDYPFQAERALLIRVEAWDVNCPRHIQERYTVEQIRSNGQVLRQRIAALEEEIGQLRERLQRNDGGS